MNVVWSEQAKLSLAQIYDYIFKDSLQNAEMFFNALLELGNSWANKNLNFHKI